jgi:hypothetical protein
MRPVEMNVDEMLAQVARIILRGESIGMFMPVGTDVMQRCRALADELGATVTSQGRMSASVAATHMGIPGPAPDGEVEFVRFDPSGKASIS